MNPYDKAHELAKSLKESEEFRMLQQVSHKVQQDVDAKRMLDDFRALQQEMEAKLYAGEQLSEDDQNQLKKLHELMQLHPLLQEYLHVEYRFGIMLTDIQKIIGDVVQSVIQKQTLE